MKCRTRIRAEMAKIEMVGIILVYFVEDSEIFVYSGLLGYC